MYNGPSTGIFFWYFILREFYYTDFYVIEQHSNIPNVTLKGDKEMH